MPGRCAGLLAALGAIVFVQFDSNNLTPTRLSRFYTPCTFDYGGPLCLDPMSALAEPATGRRFVYGGAGRYVSTDGSACLLRCPVGCLLGAPPEEWVLLDGGRACACSEVSCALDASTATACPTASSPSAAPPLVVCETDQYPFPSDCAYRCRTTFGSPLANVSCASVTCASDGTVACLGRDGQTLTQSYDMCVTTLAAAVAAAS